MVAVAQLVAMRRLGIDPGSAYIAATIIDGDVVPCAFVDALTREVGRLVPRDKPRHLMMRDGAPRLGKDGNPIILTMRRESPTDDEVEAIASEIAAWALSHGVESAAVEEVTDVHFSPMMGDAGKASMSTALVRSGKVGTIVSMRLRDAGIPVKRVKHATWGARIAKSAHCKPKDVKPIIRAAIVGWPTQTNEHERDAGGCALWDVVVFAEEAAERITPCRACQQPNGEHSAEQMAACAANMPKRAHTGGRRRNPSKPHAPKVDRIAAGCECPSPKAHLSTCARYVVKCCPKCKGPVKGHLRGLPCPPWPIGFVPHLPAPSVDESVIAATCSRESRS